LTPFETKPGDLTATRPTQKVAAKGKRKEGGPPKGSPITVWAGLEWRRRWTREARGEDGRNMEHLMAEEIPVPV
jgi:hypothetical protein